MTTIDRRSGKDRRSTERYKVTIDIEWSTSGGKKPGTLSDISINGCFVLSSADVLDGEKATLFFPIGDELVYEVQGVIENHVPEIGFALKFNELTQVQRSLIAKIVDRSKSR